MNGEFQLPQAELPIQNDDGGSCAGSETLKVRSAYGWAALPIAPAHLRS
ncbi:hypothetical protein [Arthrobacter tecti]